MDVPKRSVPTPRARRIWEEIESLTLYDLLYLRDKMVKTLGSGEGDEGTGGVREPRQPIRPAGSAGAAAPIVFSDSNGEELMSRGAELTTTEPLESLWFYMGLKEI